MLSTPVSSYRSSRRRRPLMPFEVGEFLADIAAFDTVTVGAYLLLWAQGGSLPNDDVQLARLARLSLGKWRGVKAQLWRLFTPGDRGGTTITHEQLREAQEKAIRKRAHAKLAGSRGGRTTASRFRHEIGDDQAVTTAGQRMLQHSTSVGSVSSAGRDTAFIACFDWLASEMRKSPERSSRPKRTWREEALERWKELLSRRAFDRAWDAAVIARGAVGWKRPGRPSKSPH